MIGTDTMFTNDIFVPYINKGVKDNKKKYGFQKLLCDSGTVGLFHSIRSK